VPYTATFFDPVIQYLDDHAGAISALLTAVLVAVTIVYTILNQRMVREMERARELAILPKLGVDLHWLGPTAVEVALQNVGPGAALDVDVTLIFEPVGAVPKVERRWRKNVFVSGEQHRFFPPDELNNSINTLPDRCRAVRLVGSMKDAAGKNHVVDEEFADLKEWREVLYAAEQAWVSPDREKALADEMAKKFDKPLSALARETARIAGALEDLGRRDPA
jgi:hypothetical protein